MGKVQAACGRAAFEYVERAATLALKGELDAVATAPINKESLRAAGVPYIGHTEILAGLTGAADPLTMFEVRGPQGLFPFEARVPEGRDRARQEGAGARLHRAVLRGRSGVSAWLPREKLPRAKLRREEGGTGAGVRSAPRSAIAVAGLNPHCGERGLFGDEEVREIAPAVEEARRRGYPVEGPIGADSVFHLALQGRFEAVISLYHDQGHVATKTYDFDRTISITLGLPFLRTSVDHGTAFDIAGTGAANETGMTEAVLSAARYARTYKGRA